MTQARVISIERNAANKQSSLAHGYQVKQEKNKQTSKKKNFFLGFKFSYAKILLAPFCPAFSNKSNNNNSLPACSYLETSSQYISNSPEGFSPNFNRTHFKKPSPKEENVDPSSAASISPGL